MSSNKQYEASQKHINKARKKGNVLRSLPLSRAISLIAVFIGLNLMVTFAWVAPGMLLKCYLISNLSDLGVYLQQVGWLCMLVMTASLGVAWVVSIAIDVFQVGFLFQPSLVAIDPERLNPCSGVVRLFKGWKDIPLRLVLALALGMCFWFYIDRLVLAALSDLSGAGNTAYSLSTLKIYSLTLVGCLFVHGIADYLVQRMRYFKELRMTIKEVRDEHKDSEGDPHLKALSRSMHEQLLLQELIEKVKRSKVIVVQRV